MIIYRITQESHIAPISTSSMPRSWRDKTIDLGVILQVIMPECAAQIFFILRVLINRKTNTGRITYSIMLADPLRAWFRTIY